MSARKLWGRAEDRVVFVVRLREMAVAEGCSVDISFSGTRSAYVTIASDTGHAVSLDVRPDPSLCLHWHTRTKEARYPDPFIGPGTGVNQHHFGKATSFCGTPDEVVEVLTAGLRILRASAGVTGKGT